MKSSADDERHNLMGNLPIAVQLYSVRHEAEQDLPGTLAKMKSGDVYYVNGQRLVVE